jgi:GT2 family glycosyltransferase
VVILNHNGRHHLGPCFDTLRAVDYPKEKLDALLIDNDSDDGSDIEMRSLHSWVRFVANDVNRGFAGGCNQGAELSPDAEILIFLNNDMRVEPEFVRELVSPIVRKECVATTAKMYSWDGKLIDSAGGGMNYHGIGIQHGYLEKPGPQYDEPRRTLFACGGAMAIEAPLFRTIGGFDPEYFAYYEDVDLGWRLCVQGYDTHYVPTAICYHHHSSTSRAMPSETVRLLQIRNPLLTCFKNYDESNLQRIFPAALALSMRRMLLVSRVTDDRPYRIEQARAARVDGAHRFWKRKKKRARETDDIHRLAVADMIGINDLLGNWDQWTERRAEVQAKRQRPDEEIFKLFLKPLWCVEDEPAYLRLQRGLEATMGLDEMFRDLTVSGPEPHG